MTAAHILIWIGIVALLGITLWFNNLWVQAGRETARLLNDLDARINELNRHVRTLERRLDIQ